MKRRDFVRGLPVLTTGVALGTATLPMLGCAGAPYVVPGVRPGGLVIPASALAPSGSAFVQAPGLSRPVFLRRSDQGEVVALLASCTHQGCQPEPVADRLVCPCHGSEFSFTGAVLQGPAERPLDRFEVTRTADEIFIHMSPRPGP